MELSKPNAPNDYEKEPTRGQEMRKGMSTGRQREIAVLVLVVVLVGGESSLLGWKNFS